MIRNKAVVNEDTSGNVLQLQAEIKRLRLLIGRYKSEGKLLLMVAGRFNRMCFLCVCACVCLYVCVFYVCMYVCVCVLCVCLCILCMFVYVCLYVCMS